MQDVFVQFWPHVIKPLLASINAKHIVEIGSETGQSTTKLAEYCREQKGSLDVIDPRPRFDVDTWQQQYGSVCTFHTATSLSILPSLSNYDALLIDGDHNWYTVFHELLLAEETNTILPLILMNDTCWPYGRRDLYYDITTIPSEFCHDHLQRGMIPDQSELVEFGGFNPMLEHALHEGKERNGVRTAIEDFLERSDAEYRFLNIPGFHGLGILASEQCIKQYPVLASLLKELTLSSIMLQHVELLEKKRIHSVIENQDRSKLHVRILQDRSKLHVRILQDALNVYKVVETERREKLELAHRAKIVAYQNLKIGYVKMQKTVDDLTYYSENLRKALEYMHHTLSWRITAPLRHTSMFIRTCINHIAYKTLGCGKCIWVLCGSPMEQGIRRMRHCGIVGRMFPARQGLSSLRGKEESAQKTATDTVVTGDVAVIIPCHNYGKYLTEALEGILAQSVQPKEILVVNDASDDNTKEIAQRYSDRGVDHVRVEYHDVALTRNEGARLTNSEFVLFHDADDILAPDYIEKCLHAMRDQKVAIAYGDMHHFEKQTTTMIAPEFDRKQLERENYISSHALVRRQSYDVVGGFQSLKNAHEDWDLYKRILRLPWIAAKVDSYVKYRVHNDSYLQTTLKKGCPYWKRAGLLTMPITIFTPFAGRTQTLEKYVEGIKQLDYPKELIRLHWYDSSGKKSFGKLLRSMQQQIDVGSMLYTDAPLPSNWQHTPDSLIRGRVSNEHNEQYYYELAVVRAYNTLKASCQTEFVLVLEDDIVPESSALKDMLQTFEEDVVSVVAHYACHLRGYSLVWGCDPTTGKVTHYPKRKSGITPVGGSGFGCSLFRTHALQEIDIYTNVFKSPPEWYDHLTFKQLQQKGRVLCNWNVDVEHIYTERYKNSAAPKRKKGKSLAGAANI